MPLGFFATANHRERRITVKKSDAFTQRTQTDPIAEQCWRCGSDLLVSICVAVAGRLAPLCPECGTAQVSPAALPQLARFSAN